MLHRLYFHGSYIAFLIRSILGVLLVAGTVGCGSGGDEGGTKTQLGAGLQGLLGILILSL